MLKQYKTLFNYNWVNENGDHLRNADGSLNLGPDGRPRFLGAGYPLMGRNPDDITQERIGEYYFSGENSFYIGMLPDDNGVLAPTFEGLGLRNTLDGMQEELRNAYNTDLNHVIKFGEENGIYIACGQDIHEMTEELAESEIKLEISRVGHDIP